MATRHVAGGGGNKKDSSGGSRRPELINNLAGHIAPINGAIIIPKEDGVISVSEDRTVRIWLKRDSGQYWPSICQTLETPGTTVFFSEAPRRLFIGMTSGVISEYQIADDYNSMKLRREIVAHQTRVTSLFFSLTGELVLSTGRDKCLNWHCAETGRRVGTFTTNAWCTALAYDEFSNYAFVGDYSGHISVLKITDNTYKFVNTLKGHSGSIQCLCWDAERKLLFSGSFDQIIIVWDIGSQKGTAYELQGHGEKVTALCYSSSALQLFSGSEDSTIVCWNMDVSRKETPDWKDNDICEKCTSPFFWNFKQMYQFKTMGCRQHHCRKCGMALCDNCTRRRSTIPVLGFEFDVRVCDECYGTITEEDRAPLATFHPVKHAVIGMDLDPVRNILLTVGIDKVMKLWDVSSLVS